MKEHMLVKDAVRTLAERTGQNVVAWTANNRGRGTSNLTVAVLKPGAARPPTFRAAQRAGIVERYGQTAHWRGVITLRRLADAVGIKHH
jgi:hypothetical protein